MIANFLPGGQVLSGIKGTVTAVRTVGGQFTDISKVEMKTYIRKQGAKLRDSAKYHLKNYVKKELKRRVKATLQAAISDAYVLEKINEAIDTILLKEAAKETNFGKEFADLAASVDPTGIADVVEAFHHKNCRDLWPTLRL